MRGKGMQLGKKSKDIALVEQIKTEEGVAEPVASVYGVAGTGATSPMSPISSNERYFVKFLEYLRFLTSIPLC